MGLGIKALVVLPYFERPVMVRNALESLRRNMDAAWRCVVIDDGSREPFALGEYEDLRERVEVVRVEDTVQEKIWAGGSRHSDLMSKAFAEGTEEVGVVLCDDDALVEGSVARLLAWYEGHPEAVWSWGRVVVFDPSVEAVPWGEGWERRAWFLNGYPDGPMKPAWRLDSAQVSFRRAKMPPYPARNTVNNDAAMFETMARLYGECPYNGLTVQYKGAFADQMGRRGTTDIYEVRVK